MYLPVPGFEPMCSIFLGKCVTHQATVGLNLRQIEVSYEITYKL